MFMVTEEQVPVFTIHHDFRCCVIHHYAESKAALPVCNSDDKATADSHNPEEEGTEHRTDNTDDGHSREEDQSNSTPPSTYTVWLCPICGK
jgi:uncharacterized protein (DUF2225 family)